MGSRLLRIRKWKTDLAAESGLTVEQLIGYEFSTKDKVPDLKLSVYRVDDETRYAQLHSEHAAGIGLSPPPPRGRSHFLFDLLFSGAERDIDGDCCFEYARSVHRELALNGKATLEVIAQKLIDESRKYEETVTRRDVRAYVKSCLDSRDPEWERFVADEPKGEKWREWANKPEPHQ